MIVLFFLLWLLLSGEVTLRVCVWGAVVSALLYCFCTKVLGYGWRYERRAVKKLGPGLRYLGYLIVEMLKAGLVVMKLVYTRPSRRCWMCTPACPAGISWR